MKLIQERNKSVTYKEARVYLDELSKYGSVLGLDAIRGLLRELGNPQDDLRFIHIAGTNGKGSVLAYTSTILSEAGYRIGRYVSPTVVSYRERIQVDGEMISKHAFRIRAGRDGRRYECCEKYSLRRVFADQYGSHRCDR